MNKTNYRGDLPHKYDEREYSSSEVDMGEIKFVSYATAKKNAKAYVERNQNGKSSCVPSSICNAIWNTEKLILAEEPNYRQRSNFPNEGCYWVDQLDIAVNFGMAEREVAPEVKTELLANQYQITNEIRENAKTQKQKSYIFIKSYDDFVRTLNSGYPITFSIFSTTQEYSSAKPKILGELKRENSNILHAVCAIPNTAFKGGFFITDSAHFGKVSKREITDEFMEKRLSFQGAYFIDLKTETIEKTLPFKYEWKRDLTIGDEGEDVLKLQQALQWLGFFAVNIKPTGKFHGITRQAIKDFQKANEQSILWSVGLKLPTGYFGASTRKVLNKLAQ